MLPFGCRLGPVSTREPPTNPAAFCLKCKNEQRHIKDEGEAVVFSLFGMQIIDMMRVRPLVPSPVPLCSHGQKGKGWY